MSGKRRETFPARGTWIEMMNLLYMLIRILDVPRKGNVDRNDKRGCGKWQKPVTFPARGTWIEMNRLEVPA